MGELIDIDESIRLVDFDVEVKCPDCQRSPLVLTTTIELWYDDGEDKTIRYNANLGCPYCGGKFGRRDTYLYMSMTEKNRLVFE